MKDIGKIIIKACSIMEAKQFEDADKFQFNKMTAEKIFKTLKAEKFENSGFDYLACENIVNFMAGQLCFVEEVIEDWIHNKICNICLTFTTHLNICSKI